MNIRNKLECFPRQAFPTKHNVCEAGTYPIARIWSRLLAVPTKLDEAETACQGQNTPAYYEQNFLRT